MKKILHNIRRQLWAYALVLLAAILLWDWAFGLIRQVPPEQKISIFVTSYTKSFTKYDQINLKENRPEGIDLVEVNLYSPDDTYYSALLEAVGFAEADILILPLSEVEKRTQRFATLDETYLTRLEQAGYTLGVFSQEKTICAVKVYDAESKTSLLPFLTFVGAKEEDYYLVFNRESIHLSPSDERAINVAEQLLK